jgi:hypothetical protein
LQQLARVHDLVRIKVAAQLRQRRHAQRSFLVGQMGGVVTPDTVLWLTVPPCAMVEPPRL